MFLVVFIYYHFLRHKRCIGIFRRLTWNDSNIHVVVLSDNLNAWYELAPEVLFSSVLTKLTFQMEDFRFSVSTNKHSSMVC